MMTWVVNVELDAKEKGSRVLGLMSFPPRGKFRDASQGVAGGAEAMISSIPK